MNAQQLVIYATNTGSLYETHKALARQNAMPVSWRIYIKKEVLPLYRKEFDEPYEGIARIELDEAAKLLSEYYAEHLKECEKPPVPHGWEYAG